LATPGRAILLHHFAEPARYNPPYGVRHVYRNRLITAAVLAALLCPTLLLADDESNRRMPTSGSLHRQNAVARAEGFGFMRTPADVWAKVNEGALVHLETNAAYQLAAVSFPVARPEVKLFLEQLGAEHRVACGEPLVVTSLTRPVSRQPTNAARNSVHPAGMAIDLRIPRDANCRRWLDTRLLDLQAADVLEVIRETRPPHYHVAIFPTAYRRYVERAGAAESAFIAEIEARQLRYEVQSLAERLFPEAGDDGVSGDTAPRTRPRWAMLLFAAPLSLIVWLPGVTRRTSASREVASREISYWVRFGRSLMR
jgi:hypothetical protein